MLVEPPDRAVDEPQEPLVVDEDRDRPDPRAGEVVHRDGPPRAAGEGDRHPVAGADTRSAQSLRTPDGVQQQWPHRGRAIDVRETASGRREHPVGDELRDGRRF
ncbi:hypothetical protein [Phytohabitans houttuyneae]|uniref:Uncharacterized protein n=1 Tax=Phytohabitans houttuyneae TaxID=1076126 RepID=A0A6V8JZ44_9ACTN|nr:hypothetical protein [Phytohabitans houttuyneae]GFJ78042.1 hypothetical protein Phou_022220 [Phytohabitans houttuyneae]